MSSLIVFLLGAFGAGFIVGALLVGWSYRPARLERNQFETRNLTEGGPDHIQPRTRIPSTIAESWRWGE